MAAAGRLPRAIIDLEDFTETKNIILYGDTGVGKTAQLGTLPGKVLILATETGTVTIKRFMKRYGLPIGKVKVWPVHKWSDLVDAYKYLAEGGWENWDWVCVDSATNMQQLALRGILINVVADNPNRDEDIPAIQDHQKWQNMFKRFIVDFNELPVNIVWTAQVMRKEDQEGDDITLPALQGKDYEISAWVCAQMQMVVYYGKKVSGKKGHEVVLRRMLFDGVPPYFAKDRYGVFPRFVTIAKGDEQVTTLGELVLKIDEDPAAVDKARQEMEEDEDVYKDDDSGSDEEAAPDTMALSREAVMEMTFTELKALAKEYGLEEAKKADILAALEPYFDEDDDEDSDDDDEDDDDEEDSDDEEDLVPPTSIKR